MSHERAAELSQVLRESGALPEGVRTRTPAGSHVRPWEFEAVGPFCSLGTEVETTRGAGTVSISMFSHRSYEGCESPTSLSPGRTCVERDTSDGRAVKVETDPDGPGQPIQVTVELPEDRMMLVSVQGIADRGTGNYDTTPLPGGTQPLVVEEVVNLATVPGLVF
ncbi:hypothetical protein ACRAKI_35055 [Saccharothrix isguenensis]